MASMAIGVQLPGDDGSTRISASDLFLLDRWDASSPAPPPEQAARIFREWKDIGYRGRLPFLQRIAKLRDDRHRRTQDGDASDQAQLANADKALLAQVRSPTDRVKRAEFATVRTYLGEGSYEYEVSRNTMGLGAEEFVEPRGWEYIFERVPQLLESDIEYAEGYENRMLRDLEEGYNIPGKDRIQWMYLYDHYHSSATVGTILVLDQTAVEGGPGLCVDFDDRGRVVRQTRCEDLDETESVEGLLSNGEFEMLREETELGADYEWDGPKGPMNMLHWLKNERG